MNRIAIVGSGITGLSVAYHLPHGSNITFFDKSRRPGGRVSTRTTRDHPGYSFDHGTPFVHPKGQFLALLQDINAIQEVNLQMVSSLNEHHLAQKEKKSFFIGNKKIQSIPLSIMKKLNQIHQVQQIYSTRIQELSEQGNNTYGLIDENGKKYGPFNYICFSIPFPQCLMLKQKLAQLNNQSSKITNPYDGDWVVMLAVKPNCKANEQFIKYFRTFDICKAVSDKITYAVSQRQRGYQGQDELWVFTMQKKWSQQNIELKPEQVQKIALKQIENACKIQGIQPSFLKSHRWRYAHPNTGECGERIQNNVAFCGDWAQNCQDLQGCWDLGQKISELLIHSAKKGQL